MKKLLFLFAMASLVGCNSWLNSNVMFRTGPAYPYTTFSNNAPIEYRISPRDVIEFFLYTNDGTKLIDIGMGTATAGGKVTLNYPVEIDGMVKLPVLGRVKIDGFTVREAEKMLEEKYAKYFVSPFVVLSVSNRRVMIFPTAGAARVLPLQNDNTTLIEAISLVGGIPKNGKAHKIKLIRKSGEKTEVQLIDLSKIQNLDAGNIVLQANDIIYIQPSARISQELLSELSPYLTLLSTFLLSVTLYTQVSNTVK